MYKVFYNDRSAETYSNLDKLDEGLRKVFSHKLVNDVTLAFANGKDIYQGSFFDVEHYVGYIYDGNYFTTLWHLAQALSEEVDRNMKVEWFIQNIGVCARKDNGEEIELPWYDMIDDDYDHEEYGGKLASEIDNAVAEEIEKALEECKDLVKDGCFTFSFWESVFCIEIEEEENEDFNK